MVPTNKEQQEVTRKSRKMSTLRRGTKQGKKKKKVLMMLTGALGTGIPSKVRKGLCERHKGTDRQGSCSGKLDS